MVRLWAAFLCSLALCQGFDLSPAQILARVRLDIAEQLKSATNYTCVETIERSYFASDFRRRPGCMSVEEETFVRHPFLRDRLRLDVAVSSEGEIFSWHGGKQFSSSGIDSVVRSGTASSGSFVGYLQNIFFGPGVVVRLGGKIQSSGGDTMLFNYDVPLASSHYKVQTRGPKITVPFHGSFVVDMNNLRLTKLDVIADKTPANSDICRAVVSIEYQLIDISGSPSLIPKSSSLSMTVAEHQLSESKTTFSACHAFRGESQLHFTFDDENTAASSSETPHVVTLPAGIYLSVALNTPIASDTSYIGDPVEGELLSPVHTRRSAIRIPKGAKLHGVITKLAMLSEPAPHYLLGVDFTAIEDGATTYLLDSAVETNEWDQRVLRQLYNQRYSEPANAGALGGGMVFIGSEFRTPSHKSGIWLTRQIESENAGGKAGAPGE